MVIKFLIVCFVIILFTCWAVSSWPAKTPWDEEDRGS